MLKYYLTINNSRNNIVMRRGTYQRKAIHRALSNAGRPLSVREIFESARKEAPGLGIATVYRHLKDFQLERLIAQVDLPGQSSRWETVAARHHHHFLCNKCDKLFEVQGCPENLKHLLPEGYTLEEHDILLRGRCDACT